MDPSATTGLDDGTSWANAYTTLERALDPAVNTDLVLGANLEIYIREGTYVPDGSLVYTPAIPSTDVREACYPIPTGVARIVGGFAGTETDGVPTGSTTTLSGDRGIAQDPTDNCYHVVVCSQDRGTDPTPELENLVIEDGMADQLITMTPIISSAFVAPHEALGGGVMVLGDRVRLTDVTVRNCYAEYGGGIYEGIGPDQGGAILELKSSRIRDNLAGQAGAGLLVDNGTQCQIGHSTFRGNVTEMIGGAIYTTARVADFQIYNSRIFDNTGAIKGGALYCAGDSTDTLSRTVAILNCTIAFNESLEGAGLYYEDVNDPFKQARLVHNTIVYSNPGLANDDNLANYGDTVIDVSNSLIGVRVNDIQANLQVLQGFGWLDKEADAVIDPRWVNPAARNFRLLSNSYCIDQGFDGLITQDELDIDEDLNVTEFHPREFFMGIPAGPTQSTREYASSAGAISSLGDIGSERVPTDPIPGVCDIGAFEYRVAPIGQ